MNKDETAVAMGYLSALDRQLWYDKAAKASSVLAAEFMGLDGIGPLAKRYRSLAKKRKGATQDRIRGVV